MNNKGSIPEPNPVNKGDAVTPELLNIMNNLKERSTTPIYIENLITLIEARDAFGFSKYGQHLMSKDGRNGYEDARQELGDLLQYAMKLKMQESNSKQDCKRLLNDAHTAMLILIEILG